MILSKADKLRTYLSADLRLIYVELKKELFNLRFQVAAGQLKNTMRIRNVKKSIARVLTVLKEFEKVDGKIII
ncbi:MAG: 50S ribosomal protein L29 [Firmicutes bacterium]|nr:50S ribosomal protein L29 [Bacillota bacterium]